jgi:hypothetical protein
MKIEFETLVTILAACPRKTLIMVQSLRNFTQINWQVDKI